jgi:hypothetical protein
VCYYGAGGVGLSKLIENFHFPFTLPEANNKIRKMVASNESLFEAPISSCCPQIGNINNRRSVKEN